MTTMKRRIVYFSDEDWAETKARASERQMTVSSYIRASVIGGDVIPRFVQEAARKMTQADRDAVLRKVNRGKG